MLRQTILAIVVLIILIVSQVVWFNQLWKMDKSQLQKEITTKISDSFSFQSLFANISRGTQSDQSDIQIYERDNSAPTPKGVPSYKIKKEDFGTNKTLGSIIENVYMNIALEEGTIKLSYVDSIFQKSFARLNEITYYSFSFKKNGITIDSISHGKKIGFSSVIVNLPLGDKKIYTVTGFFVVKPTSQIRNMLFSIGITAIAVILVAILILLQLLQIRKKTLQLQWREKTVSGIVHDLKSPLSYVYTMLGFFGSSEKDTSKQLSLNTAKIRVKYLSEKIELILSAVRASNSRLKMNRSSYSFNVRCQEIMDELKMIYKEKQIDFELLSSSDLILNVDNFYFEGCIRNLLDNAVKYSPENVEISVSSALKNNRIFLYFKDNGSGVPKKMHKKVFKEFYRNIDSVNIKGHGIGLSFARQIVEAHKGKIYIQNNNEKGTKFVIELPSLTNNHSTI